MSDNRSIESATVAALGQDAPRERRAPSGWLFTIVLMAVFFMVMMMCLVSGVTMYRNVTAMQARENALHLQSGLMAGIVHMNDSADAVQRFDGPQGDALVLVEHLESGTYETRVYRYGGSIVQEYAIAGRDLNPGGAIAIMASDVFEFSYDDGLLTFITDQGSSQVALRSVQGADSVESAGFADAALAAGAALDDAGAGDAR